ncbi:MAG: hypothetical protein KC444_06565, partial [Nitrosopumilus sp.]|nr:hypothetical protein [Nitrosopumilus sp.]
IWYDKLDVIPINQIQINEKKILEKVVCDYVSIDILLSKLDETRQMPSITNRRYVRDIQYHRFDEDFVEQFNKEKTEQNEQESTEIDSINKSIIELIRYWYDYIENVQTDSREKFFWLETFLMQPETKGEAIGRIFENKISQMADKNANELFSKLAKKKNFLF